MAMSVCRTLPVEKVKKSIRKMDYGILGTIDNNGCTSSNKRFVWGVFSFDEICIVCNYRDILQENKNFEVKS